MEVHHHPHVEKKSFKEYLLEGLMIFLAVTLGFFAETIREHLVEKEKERQYVESLCADLQSDIRNADSLIGSTMRPTNCWILCSTLSVNLLPYRIKETLFTIQPVLVPESIPM